MLSWIRLNRSLLHCQILMVRTELRRLFGWLKKKKVTTIVTGEKGDATLTRQGLEEYVSDCVILLDHRVSDQSSIRRLRIVKYRGSTHGTNEYPFLIDEDGFSVLPVTSLGLRHISSKERISTGIPRLDTMLSGDGYFRGSTVLVSGTAGTGKTSLAAQFVEAACKRGESGSVFCFRRISQPIYAQYVFYRNSFRALGKKRIASLPRNTSYTTWAGTSFIYYYQIN